MRFKSSDIARLKDSTDKVIRLASEIRDEHRGEELLEVTNKIRSVLCAMEKNAVIISHYDNHLYCDKLNREPKKIMEAQSNWDTFKEVVRRAAEKVDDIYFYDSGCYESDKYYSHYGGIAQIIGCDIWDEIKYLEREDEYERQMVTERSDK